MFLRSKGIANKLGLITIISVLCQSTLWCQNQQGTGQTPTTQTPTQTGSQTTQTPPSTNPTQTQLPPNSGTAPLNPDNDAQQSTQPQTGLQQQQQQTTPNTNGPQPISPRPTNGPVNQSTLPTTAAPVGTTQSGGTTTTTTTTQNGVPQTPGQNVGIAPGIAPAQLPPDPPPVAPDFRAPARPLPSADRIGVDVSTQVPLSLNDAIALTLKNNTSIDASRVDVRIAEFNLTAARGVYDPVLSSESYYERRTTPTSSSIGGGANGSVTQTDPTADVRLSGLSPFGGGAYQMDFSSTRLTTNNQFATLNPQYPTSFTFTYTQPLLRGLRFDVNRRNIEIAKKNLSLSDLQFRQQTIDIITQVQQAYWDLVFSLRNLQVQIDAVRQARIQVESNQRLVQQGVLAPIDIVAATNQVTTFEQNVYTAQQAVTTAENTLKTLMLPDRTAPLWSSALTPVTPIALDAPVVQLDRAINSALHNRPELAQLQTSREINDIDVRYYKDLTKPQVNLVGTYNPMGLAGSAVPATQTSSRGTSPALTERVNELSTIAGLEPLPSATSTSSVSPDLIGGYGQSLRNILDNRYPTYRIGLSISLPLRNRTAEANLGRTLAQGTRINDQLAQARLAIEADVRNNLQAVVSGQARLAAAAAARSSAEQQYSSEQRKFKAGTTTMYLVLQRQTDWLAAQGRELQAQTDLNKALSNLQRATGSTLSANNVSIRQENVGPQFEKPVADSSGGTVTNSFAPAGSMPQKK